MVNLRNEALTRDSVEAFTLHGADPRQVEGPIRHSAMALLQFLVQLFCQPYCYYPYHAIYFVSAIRYSQPAE